MEDSGDFPGRPSVPRQAGREPPPPALNKEPFAGTGAPAPGRLLRPESAGSVLPLLAIHAESGGAQAGGGDPRSAHGFASPPRHRAGPELLATPKLWGLCAAPTWWGSRPPHPASGPLHHIHPFPVPRLAEGAPPAGAGPRLPGTRGGGGAAGPGAQGPVPHGDLWRRPQAGRAPGGGCSHRPSGVHGHLAHPTPGPKWLFAALPGVRPSPSPTCPTRPGRGARALHHPGPGRSTGARAARPGLGLGGRPRTRSAPDHARPEAGGCRPAAPSDPAPAPAPPLVPGLGAGGDAGGRLSEDGARRRRRGGRAAAVSLAPSRPAPTLFNCGRPRADTPHGLTAWLRRPGQ